MYRIQGRRVAKETSELLVAVVSEGRMYVWPELPDDEVCPVKNNVGEPALTGLRPRAILTRIISDGFDQNILIPIDLQMCASNIGRIRACPDEMRGRNQWLD